MTIPTGQDPLHINPLSAGLYIVSTPIGNLRDITLRALDVLGTVDYILAEDTRHSSTLLRAYDIRAKLVSYNDHNGEGRRPKILEDLRAGQRIALISDAGTPLVSDPGWKLTHDVQTAGIAIFPLPGPSAILAALVKSGLPSDQFHFGGFLPQKAQVRQTYLETLRGLNATLIFFESPRRTQDSLKTISDVFGENCQVAILRELTKTFEENHFGLVQNVIAALPEKIKGEIAICVRPPREKDNSDRLISTLELLLKETSLKTAADIAAHLGLSSRTQAYKAGLKLKNEAGTKSE